MAESIFDQVFATFLTTKPTRRPQGPERGSEINALTKTYLRAMDRHDSLSPDEVRNELRTIFKNIRSECDAYGRGKRHIRMNILRILNALDQGINAKRGEYLLAKWKGWEDMLNPASPNYIGINLPGSMILEGYLVFEDLIPIREYFVGKFDDGYFAFRRHT
jgi:hypothetical protein